MLMSLTTLCLENWRIIPADNRKHGLEDTVIKKQNSEIDMIRIYCTFKHIQTVYVYSLISTIFKKCVFKVLVNVYVF